jgi:dUTP pyrophosphatase
MSPPHTLTVPVRILPHGEGLPLPDYATAGAAGLDLMAAIPADQSVVVKKLARALVPAGITLHLPVGFEAQVRPRSGLALNHGITVLNAPGTIDADYRGEIRVLLINLGEDDFVVRRGMRIAQMVVAPVTRVALQQAAQIAGSERGSGGFGSTGT